MRTKKVDLVFEGGGVRGNALVGALQVLEERGYEAQNRAGTSAGAIVATLHAAGYTGADLRAIIEETRFISFLDTGPIDWIPLVGVPLGVAFEHGLFEGNAFLAWMRRLLDEAPNGPVRTFDDLRREGPEETSPLFGFAVQVIASDLTGRRMLVLPRDAARLGVDDPGDLDVALAVRMSMSIPVFFEPVRFRNPTTGDEHVIVDGGVLSNFPVWLFDVEGRPPWPTFGLRLVASDTKAARGEALPESVRIRRGPLGALDFAEGLVATLIEAHDRLYIEQADFVRTIPIDTCGVRATDFHLGTEQAIELYESGRQAAEDFLARWDFTAYKREFRGRKSHSRSDEAAAAMQPAKRRGSSKPKAA